MLDVGDKVRVIANCGEDQCRYCPAIGSIGIIQGTHAIAYRYRVTIDGAFYEDVLADNLELIDDGPLPLPG